MVDGRDADAADRADHVLVLWRLALLLQQAGQCANHGACVLLLEEERLDVGVLEVSELGVGACAVDDREVHLGELPRHGADGLLHEEADSDHEVVVLGGEVGQVRHVVIAALRLDHAGLELEFGFRLLEPEVGEVVEALVVEAADVGDQADVVRLGGWGRGTAARCEQRQYHAGHGYISKSRKTHANLPLTTNPSTEAGRSRIARL